MISYLRQGGHKPPRDNERLRIEDNGAFTLWRSVGWATYPPSPIGRFSGRLDPAENQALKEEARAAVQAGHLRLVPKPDAAVETISLGDFSARLGIHQEPDLPWGPVINHLRQLLFDLTRKPQAAVALELLEGGHKASLRHLGTEPIRLDLSQLAVRAVLWQGYRKVGDWHFPGQDSSLPAEVTAVPGWSLELPFDHQFELNDETKSVAYVNFSLHDDDEFVPASLSTSRDS